MNGALLPQIGSPADLQTLSDSELVQLAGEMREELIGVVGRRAVFAAVLPLGPNAITEFRSAGTNAFELDLDGVALDLPGVRGGRQHSTPSRSVAFVELT